MFSSAVWVDDSYVWRMQFLPRINPPWLAWKKIVSYFISLSSQVQTDLTMSVNLHNVSKISSRTKSRKRKKHAKHFFFLKTEFSHSVSAQLIVSIVTFLYFSLNSINLGQQLPLLDLLCWLTDSSAGEGGRKKKKKATRSSPRLYSPTSCPPPISVSFMSFKNNSSLTNEARLIQRQPGCTNWAQHPFYSLSFQEQCSWWNLLWAYLRALMNDWMLFFDGLLMPKRICLQFQNENLHYRGMKCQLPSLPLTHDPVVFSSGKIQIASRG